MLAPNDDLLPLTEYEEPAERPSITISGGLASGGLITTTTSAPYVYTGTIPPTIPTSGTVWVNSSTSTMYVSNGTQWIETSST